MLPKGVDFRNRNLLAQAGVRDGLAALLVIAVALVSFSLGRLSKIEGKAPGVTITEAQPERGLPAAVSAAPIAGGVVASKSGSKYHLPWCAGAQSIREENKIWFKTVEEAKRAGYTPASNCKGLE
jgi:hypothetical protein